MGALRWGGGMWRNIGALAAMVWLAIAVFVSLVFGPLLGLRGWAWRVHHALCVVVHPRAGSDFASPRGREADQRLSKRSRSAVRRPPRSR